MVSETSASRYKTSASRYHPRYQSRSSMYIRGLILRNFAELDEAVPIVPCGDVGQVWYIYLIVSIADLCHLSHFCCSSISLKINIE